MDVPALAQFKLRHYPRQYTRNELRLGSQPTCRPKNVAARFSGA